MLRLLHTADWHLGLACERLGARAGRVRQARLDVIDRMAAHAREQRVHAVLVAGDQFDDNQVDAATVAECIRRLEAFAPIPVYLIPGNHDPLTRESVYRRAAWQSLREHIHLLTDCTPVRLADDALLLPCPLHSRLGSTDPTAAMPVRSGPDLRIGLAHGSVQTSLPQASDFPIPINCCTARGLDYLALGHWHSRWPGEARVVDRRLQYSGTPEPTKFGEPGAGQILLVALSEPGVQPTVEPITVGRLAFREVTLDLQSPAFLHDADALVADADAERCVLHVAIRGLATADRLARLDAIQQGLAVRYLHVEVDRTAIVPPHALELGHQLTSPHWKLVAERLTALHDDPERGQAARRATELLLAWNWEAGGQISKPTRPTAPPALAEAGDA